MDLISKGPSPFSAGRLASLPKHKAFGVKETAGKFTPGKRAARGGQGPLTRRLQALQKNDSVSAFGVDHAVEIEKFVNPLSAAKLGSTAGKAVAGIRSGGTKLAAAGTKKKFNAIPRMAAGKGGNTAYKVGTAQQKVGGAIAGASNKTFGLGAAGVGGAAVGGGAAFGLNRKKP